MTTSSSKKRAKNTNVVSVPKVALVMDWLTDVGGAERVLKSISEIYPSAPIYTSQYRPKRIDWFKDREVKTGWLNIFPAKLRRFIGPLRQAYFSHLDLSDYDIVISVTGAEAKSVKTKGKNHSAIHFCYCHVPTQYYWGAYDTYLENPGFGPLNPLARLGLKLFVHPLRKADYKASQRPDFFITISTYAASEIKKYYKRKVKVIHPPVSTKVFRTPVENSTTKKTNVKTKKTEQTIQHGTVHRYGETAETVLRNVKTWPERPGACPQDTPQPSPRNSVPSPYYINFSRQVSWKRLDLIVKSCMGAKKHLVLIGDGPEHNSLVKLANQSSYIHFLPQMPQSELKKYLKSAKAFLFPSQEPFGIAPLEALAAGCPVIAYGKGGALDYIEEGKNGLLFPRQTVRSLTDAIEAYEKLYAKKGKIPFQKKALRASAEHFSEENFKRKLKGYIDEEKS